MLSNSFGHRLAWKCSPRLHAADAGRAWVGVYPRPIDLPCRFCSVSRAHAGVEKKLSTDRQISCNPAAGPAARQIAP